MSDSVKIVVFKAGPYAEVDVSKPHVVVPEDGATVSVSPELALKLIRSERAELADPEPEEVEDETEVPVQAVLTTGAFVPVVAKNEAEPIPVTIQTLQDATLALQIQKAQEAEQASSADADKDPTSDEGEGEKSPSALS